MLWIRFGLPHVSIASILWCMCAHPINPMGIHLLHCVHNNECIKNPWCSLRHLCCHCVKCWLPCAVITTTCASFKHIQLLLLTNQHCAHQRWHSHFSWCYHCQPNMSGFISPILMHPRICYFQCGSSQRMELSRSTPYRLIPPLSSGRIWMFT